MVVLAEINWGQFPYYLTDGLCIGAIYALIALGYTMVYGIIKLINFAHGEFFMVGAYGGLGIYLLFPPDTSGWIMLPVILLVGGVCGTVIAILAERLAYKPIREADRLVALLTAIGVSFFLQNLFTFIRNGNPLSFQKTVGEGDHQQLVSDDIQGLVQHSVEIGGQGFQTVKFSFIVISLVLMVFLWYVTMRTRFGRAMRATSQDLDAARLMGINVDRIIMLTFALGGFFAGVAGGLVGMIRVVSPYMGFMPGLIAFVAAVVGGIGSIPGAVIGGFLLGLIEQLAVWLQIPSAYTQVVAFSLLIVVLVVRPQGILGKPEREKV